MEYLLGQLTTLQATSFVRYRTVQMTWHPSFLYILLAKQETGAVIYWHQNQSLQAWKSTQPENVFSFKKKKKNKEKKLF